MGLQVALVACWRLWGLCGSPMFDCVAAMGGIVRGAALVNAAQHDHFGQAQHACTAQSSSVGMHSGGHYGFIILSC